MPDEIINTINDAIGGFVANPIVQFALQALAVYFVVLWLAAAYWAFRDMQQRSENPILPYLAAALIVLFTPLLFVFGIIVYRIVRPHEKIGEVYERNLAEEALLAEVEAMKTCPQCRRRVNDEWIICPTCRTQLSRVCANCGRLVGLDWALCAWCGRDFERADIAAYAPISTQLPARSDPTSTRLEPTAPPVTYRGGPHAADGARPPAAVGRAERTGHDPGALTEPSGPDPAAVAPVEPVAPVAPVAPRLATFSLEGRAVPALYLVGWVGSVMGLAIVLVSVLASSGVAAAWLFLAGDIVLAVGLVSAAGSQAIERGRRTDLRYRGPSPVLAFVAVFAVTVVATVAVLAPLSALGLDAGSPAATTIQLSITMLAYVGIIRLLVVGPGALAWAEMGVTRPSPAAVRELLVGAVLALPVLAVALILGAVVGRFVEPAPSPLPEATSVTGLILNLVSAAIIAPIGEELFFRGFTTTAWARTEGPRRAIVRGAVFFAVAHIVALFDATFATGAQRALYSFVVLLPVGIALGWVFLARRSVYASIGLHAAFNAIQVIALVAATGLG